MATPVNTVASGGLPVTDVTASPAPLPLMGMPVSEAAAGKGIAVTKVANGKPVTFVTPPP
jgi:hypothetical protein